jgi:predicted nucleic acid-binding protein
MRILLDTGVLGYLCHPAKATSRPVVEWLAGLLIADRADLEVILPEICDYELRRKLLHLVTKGQGDARSVQRLDDLGKLLEFLPLDTDTLRNAAQLWADARTRGRPTAPDHAIDGDVILAAQAIQVGGVIVTSNRKHLSQFVATLDWTQVH